MQSNPQSVGKGLPLGAKGAFGEQVQKRSAKRLSPLAWLTFTDPTRGGGGGGGGGRWRKHENTISQATVYRRKKITGRKIHLRFIISPCPIKTSETYLDKLTHYLHLTWTHLHLLNINVQYDSKDESKCHPFCLYRLIKPFNYYLHALIPTIMTSLIALQVRRN